MGILVEVAPAARLHRASSTCGAVTVGLDMHGHGTSAGRLAQQEVFEVLHRVPEVLQLLCQGHFGLGKQLTLFVLDMLFHREA